MHKHKVSTGQYTVPFRTDTLAFFPSSWLDYIGGNAEVNTQHVAQPKGFIHQGQNCTMLIYVPAGLDQVDRKLRSI